MRSILVKPDKKKKVVRFKDHKGQLLKQKTIKDFIKQEKLPTLIEDDEDSVKTNPWAKKVKEVEYSQYLQKMTMKDLGMMTKDGEYDYKAYNDWISAAPAFDNLSISDISFGSFSFGSIMNI